MASTEPSSRAYGGMGVALVRALAERGGPTFTIADVRTIAGTIGVADSYLAVLLHRLERAGLVRRVKRCAYTLAPGLLPEAHPFAIGMALVEPCAVSGWAALNHHGLTEQIPRVITLTTPKRVVTPSMRGAAGRTPPSMWQVGEQRYEIVSVVPAHFFGDEEVWVGDARVRIFDRERALLDCFALPRRFGGLAEGLGILEQHVRELKIDGLAEYAKRYGSAAVAKRVGWALEHLRMRPSPP